MSKSLISKLNKSFLDDQERVEDERHPDWRVSLQYDIGFVWFLCLMAYDIALNNFRVFV